ncbi:MAG: tRNA threonylcarbamoyladenosine dehydratase [Lentisphaeria bacterium]|nr:tRNA threonylcarbamoyladenosine dehydratase [Lentisphaeria bacterium]
MSQTEENFLHRTRLLLGNEAVERLQKSRVLIAGIGGGAVYAAEALARGGIGSLTVYDPDRVHISNINRQILALHKDCSRCKTDILRERLQEINPALELNAFAEAMTLENIGRIVQNGSFDYIVDAIDPVNEKCCLLAAAVQHNIPVISAMGAGCRLDPAQVKYADISKTYNCRLARSVRARLKKEYGITGGIRCVFSAEPPLPEAVTKNDDGSLCIGSSSFMPGIFGLFMAAEVLRKLSRAREIL